MPKVSWSAACGEIERELRHRRGEYPNQIASGDLHPQVAKRQHDRLQAVYDLLLGLNQDSFRRLVEEGQDRLSPGGIGPVGGQQALKL